MPRLVDTNNPRTARRLIFVMGSLGAVIAGGTAVFLWMTALRWSGLTHGVSWPALNPRLSSFENWAVSTARWHFLAWFLIAVAGFVASVGLLLRKRWARPAFRVVIVGGVTYYVALTLMRIAVAYVALGSGLRDTHTAGQLFMRASLLLGFVVLSSAPAAWCFGFLGRPVAREQFAGNAGASVREAGPRETTSVK